MADASVPSRPLTPKQQRFVEEYLVDLNATQAAVRAGYSARTAHSMGPQLLANIGVAAAIAEGQLARSERVQLQSDDVLSELRAIVRSNVQHFRIGEYGEVQLADDAPPDAWRAVSSVKHKIRSDDNGVTREVELKLWDKNTAIANAMKHLGLLKDGANVTLNQTNNTQVNVWQFGDKAVSF